MTFITQFEGERPAMRPFGLAFENNQKRKILLKKYREMMRLSGRQPHFNKFQEQQGLSGYRMNMRRHVVLLHLCESPVS
jgi:hypothetical protein